jgi:vancomycin resistance protein YoaR
VTTSTSDLPDSSLSDEPTRRKRRLERRAARRWWPRRRSADAAPGTPEAAARANAQEDPAAGTATGFSLRTAEPGDGGHNLDAPDGRRRRSWRTLAIAAGATPVALLLAAIAGWAIDASVGGREVGRNVTIVGRDVGGLTEDELRPVVREISANLAEAKVELVLPETTIPTTAGTLGLRLDEQRTIDAAFAVDEGRPLLARPFAWVGSFFRSETAPVAFAVSSAEVSAALVDLDAQTRTPATEPRLAFERGEVVAQPGKPGAALAASDLMAELSMVRSLSGGVLRIKVTPTPVAPKLSDADARRLAEDVNEATASDIEGVLDEESRDIPGERLRPLVGSEVVDGRLRVTLDQTKTLEVLAEAFDGVGTPPGQGELTIRSGRVQITPGEPGLVCCGPTDVAALAAVLQQRQRTIELSLVEKQSTKDQAYYDKLGIIEKVAEFTTEHPAGQPRVTNIHIMAEAVRGAVIEPGATFSINSYVGQRTRDKGYVAAPIIDANGNFDEDVGGGVSQFATTLFNAAFFAGLDIPEYMAHGLYISRYPYGREATLSFPGPDLKITNITPYGILIWTSYSDTSITVQLYSTPYIEAGQVGQSTETYGKVCTTVTTTRLRTWLTTGEERYDRFYALYGPEEGVQCDGTKVPKKGETTTTSTTAPGATTTSTAPGQTSTTGAGQGGSTTTTAPGGSTTTTGAGATTSTAAATTSTTTAGAPGSGSGSGDGGGGSGTGAAPAPSSGG